MAEEALKLINGTRTSSDHDRSRARREVSIPDDLS
jgi:hypothetical protein